MNPVNHDFSELQVTLSSLLSALSTLPQMEKDIELATLATPTSERTIVLQELTLDDSSTSQVASAESKNSKFWAWASVVSAYVATLLVPFLTD